jgi:hypothetical protein
MKRSVELFVAPIRLSCYAISYVWRNKIQPRVAGITDDYLKERFLKEIRIELDKR